MTPDRRFADTSPPAPPRGRPLPEGGIPEQQESDRELLPARDDRSHAAPLPSPPSFRCPPKPPRARARCTPLGGLTRVLLAASPLLLPASGPAQSLQGQSLAGPDLDARAVERRGLSEQALRELLDDARALVGQSRYPEAITAYSLYLEKQPHDLQALLELARVLSWSKDFGRSADLYQALLEQVPGDPELELERAHVMLWAGQYAEAARVLAGLRRQHAPEEADPRATPDAGATSDVEFSPALAARGPDALLERIERALADAYAWSGQLDAALPLYRRLWGLAPFDTVLGLAYARALSQRRHYPEALAVYHELERGGLVSPEFRLELGRVLLWAEQYPAGLRRLESLRQHLLTQQANGGKGSATLLDEISRTLAAGYAWSGDHSLAITEYQALLQNQPATPELLLPLARSLREVFRVDDAVARYDDYLRLKPQDLEVELERGRVLLWSERYPSAIAAFTSVRDRLAGPEVISGLDDAARDRLRDEAGRQLTRAWLWSGRPREARRQLEQLTHRGSDELTLASEIARALAQQGAMDEARLAYAQLEALGGSSLEADVGIAETYRWEGDALRAQRVLLGARARDPQQAEVLTALSRLEPLLRHPMTPSLGLRFDSDGMAALALTFSGERPWELIWIGGGLTVDRFTQTTRALTRFSPSATVRYRHDAQISAQGLLGIQLSTVEHSPLTLRLDLSGRWKPLPEVQLEAALNNADAVDLVFTERSLDERVRQRAGSLTATWTPNPAWEGWAQTRLVGLDRPAALCSDLEVCSNLLAQVTGQLDHRLKLPHPVWTGARAGLGAGLLHFRETDLSGTYWSPVRYAGIWARGGAHARLERGMTAEIRLRLGLAWASDVEGMFPEVAGEAYLRQSLGERLGWSADLGYGRTVRQLDIAADPSGSNYWSGRVGLQGWYLF